MSLKDAGEDAGGSISKDDDSLQQWLLKFNGTWKLRERTNFEQVFGILFIVS